MTLLISETYINKTENHCIGGTPEPYEPVHSDDINKLFRHLSRHYGRCTGKVYIDDRGGKTSAIGWVFTKRMSYEDDPKQTYLQETWVTLHDAPPTRTIKHHYHTIIF